MGIPISRSVSLGWRLAILRRIDQPPQLFPDRDGGALRAGCRPGHDGLEGAGMRLAERHRAAAGADDEGGAREA